MQDDETKPEQPQQPAPHFYVDESLLGPCGETDEVLEPWASMRRDADLRAARLRRRQAKDAETARLRRWFVAQWD